MADRNIGNEILEGILEIKAYKAGKTDLKTRKLPITPLAKETQPPNNYPVPADKTE